MKDKILLFIIGVLVGAIISTGAFLAYTKASSNNCSNTQMKQGTPPSMQNGQNSNQGQPPEKPSGEDNQQSDQTNNNDTQNNN